MGRWSEAPKGAVLVPRAAAVAGLVALAACGPEKEHDSGYVGTGTAPPGRTVGTISVPTDSGHTATAETGDTADSGYHYVGTAVGTCDTGDTGTITTLRAPTLPLPSAPLVRKP